MDTLRFSETLCWMALDLHRETDDPQWLQLASLICRLGSLAAELRPHRYLRAQG